jgi:hypothetical protein
MRLNPLRHGTQIQSAAVEHLYLADGDGRSVAAGLLGRGLKVAERRVGDAVGVGVEGCGVFGIEAFDQVLGGERPAVATLPT